ncbi:tail fiber domain-containing protein [Dokdonia sp.]|uniref:tail fiber domain-containing protein n=1 Tax=Dokdonia sp. TaxID=2024995 RepID=UPI0032670263
MKKYLFLILLFPITLISQTIGMSYKAIVRDDTGTVMANQELRVDLTLNILTINFPAYIETHMVTTDENGLMMLTIGEGTPINGTFSSLDWLNDRFELNVQIDPGSGLIDLGSTPIYSVPYSYHAQTATNAQTALNAETAVLAETATIAIDVENISGLELLDEGNGIGRRLAGSNPDNYGPIGLHAVDISFSAAPGNFAGALGTHSFAQGVQSSASGDNSVALGFSAEASGAHSMSLGSQSDADGDYSFAGPEASANGDYSVALGDNAFASGFNAVALGSDCSAQADSSFSAGFGNNIFPDAVGSIALGFENANRANNSITLGNYVWSDSYQSIVLGTYNTIIPGTSESIFLPGDPLLQIGNGTSFSERSTALMILKNGNIGIGVTNPLELLHVNGNIRIDNILRIGTETIEDTGTNQLSFNAGLFPDNDGAFNLGNSSFRWNAVWSQDGTINTSDRREKENIRDLNYGLTEVLQLDPVRFQWKNNPQQGEKLGLIAQDLLKVIPEVVKTHEFVSVDEEGTLQKKELDRLGVYYSDLIPVLIKAVQEQQEIILKQQTKIETLEAKTTEIAELKNRMTQLEASLKTAIR